MTDPSPPPSNAAVATAGDAAAAEPSERLRIVGRVQGVGFRAHVLRLALRHGIRGWVANVGDDVRAHAAGPAAAFEAFVTAIEAEAPRIARVERIEREPAGPPAQRGFEIR